jgi:hypothetical protein
MSATRAGRQAVPRRWQLAAAVATVIGVAAPTPAVAAEEPDVQHEVLGEVVHVISDPPGHDEAGPDNEHEHQASVTQTYADVDGTLVDLSAVQAPVLGTEPPPADALAAGTEVAVSIRADAGLDRDAAVAAAGSAAGQDVALADGTEPQAVVVAAVPTATADLPATADLAGIHQLVVLPVVWSAGEVGPIAPLQAAATGVEQYWERQSGGRVDIRTSVRATQVVRPATTCATGSIMADALAANPGVAPSATTHVAVHFPYLPACPFAGRATITGGSIWLNGDASTYVLAHELGHNFGLGHANTLTCTSAGVRVPLATTTSDCTAREYGDNADVMGQGRNMTSPGNINSGFADYLGWATVADLTGAVTSSRDVTLAPLAATAAQRALRVTSSVGTVYLDYRPAAGPDALHEPGWAGVQAHLLSTDPTYRYPTSYLLDLQPAQAPFFRPFLPVGGSWQVPGGQTTLTTTSTGTNAVVTAGPSAGTAQVQRYVTRVYQDLFGRTPDAQGFENWTRKLLTGTPRSAVAASITASNEYRSGMIADAYQRYLGRGPDAQGAAYWLQAMRTGSTIQQVETRFLISAEFSAAAGGTDAGWVTSLYQEVLGRAATPAEVSTWTGRLDAGMTRTTVATRFLVSTEHLTTVVDRYYVELLGRSIDPVGRSTWVTAIQNGSRVETIIGRIIASAEYYGNV